jgi:branched-subunit amino acid transport protein
MTWIAIGALAAVCVAMRVAVPLILGDRRPDRLEGALTTAVPALLAGLVVTGACAEGRTITADPRLAGVAAGLVVVALRGPMLIVVLTAAGTTAVLRLLL